MQPCASLLVSLCSLALLACAAPAYQIQQFYVFGKVDDCTSKWTEFVDCLKKKTRYREEVRLNIRGRSSHAPRTNAPCLFVSRQVVQAEAEKQHPLWDVRTHKEAQQFWQREFGHLSGKALLPGDEADGPQHSGKPTLV